MNVPNLDCMSCDELLAFWSKYHRPTRKNAAELIGDRRAGYIRQTEKLAAYAMAKNCAQSLRLEGKIAQAETYEHGCEIYYAGLDEDLRW